MKASVPAPWQPARGPVVPALLAQLLVDSVLRVPLQVASVLPQVVSVPLVLLLPPPADSVLQALAHPLVASVPPDSVPVAWA